MGMKIRRDDFLRTLELVQYGVAQRETVELSQCFVFQNGRVSAYNDEILCRAKSGLDKGVSGAVEAQRLLNILRKLPDAELELAQKNGEIILTGKRKKDYFKLEPLEGRDLPDDQVEKPSAWHPLPDDFGEAVGMVQDCAASRDSTFARTCVHVTPKYMEAYDNFQMCRYRIKLPLASDSLLILKENIKHIASLGMVAMSETDNWVHFKNPTGLVFSCRRFLEEYPDLSEYFKAQGEAVILPKGLDEIIDRAQEFSQELADANRVKVVVKPGMIHITGMGITGRHEEYRPIKNYQGREYSFLIAPNLLTSLVKKYDEAQLTESVIIVKGANRADDESAKKPTSTKWTYLAALTNPDDVEEESAAPSEAPSKEHGDEDE